MTFQVEAYRPGDEASWLRCRVLSFLGTTYYDDVVTAKPDADAPVQLVARDGGTVVGLLDATLAGHDATVECVAVHPDHQRRGLASRLLDAALDRLVPMGARRIDAWTREDAAALAWYRAEGFVETTRYLHVYANGYAGDLDGGLADAVRSAAGLHAVQVFAHAPLEREAELRGRYRRVYVCCRFERDLRGC